MKLGYLRCDLPQVKHTHTPKRELIDAAAQSVRPPQWTQCVPDKAQTERRRTTTRTTFARFLFFSFLLFLSFFSCQLSFSTVCLRFNYWLLLLLLLLSAERKMPASCHENGRSLAIHLPLLTPICPSSCLCLSAFCTCSL